MFLLLSLKINFFEVVYYFHNVTTFNLKQIIYFFKYHNLILVSFFDKQYNKERYFMSLLVTLFISFLKLKKNNV